MAPGPLAMSRQEAVNRQEIVCDRCRNGRLLGEAVHDRDGGWRYFLSCYGCGARTPLGEDAHRELMETKSVEQPRVVSVEATPATDRPAGTQPRPPSAPPEGSSSFADRKHTCAHPGCTTKISIYNSSTKCFAHS